MTRSRPRGAAPDDESPAATGWEGAGRGGAVRRSRAGEPGASRARTGDRRGAGATARGRRTSARSDPARADKGGTDQGGTDQGGTDQGGTDQGGTGKGFEKADRAARGRGRRGAGRDRGRDPLDVPGGGVEDAGDLADTAPRRRRFGLGRTRPRDGATTRSPRRPVPAHIRRRRLAAALAAVLVLLAGVGVGTWLLLYGSGLADVEDVTVTGLSTVPEQAVRDAAAIMPGGPLVAVDTTGIAGRVAAVEGVASVYVRRAWPHTVEVNVTERVPVALWQGPQGLFEVDGTGLSYRQAPEPPPALPRLAFAGVAPQDPSTGAALAVLHDLTDPLRAQVATVDVAGTKVTFGLADGRSVRWGDPDRSPDKIAVLAALLGQPGKVYDVSSPDLPTVRP